MNLPDERTVWSLSDAAEWFLSHASGSVKCVEGDREQICNSYQEALAFFLHKV